MRPLRQLDSQLLLLCLVSRVLAFTTALGPRCKCKRRRRLRLSFLEFICLLIHLFLLTFEKRKKKKSPLSFYPSSAKPPSLSFAHQMAPHRHFRSALHNATARRDGSMMHAISGGRRSKHLSRLSVWCPDRQPAPNVVTHRGKSVHCSLSHFFHSALILRTTVAVAVVVTTTTAAFPEHVNHSSLAWTDVCARIWRPTLDRMLRCIMCRIRRAAYRLV